MAHQLLKKYSEWSEPHCLDSHRGRWGTRSRRQGRGARGLDHGQRDEADTDPAGPPVAQIQEGVGLKGEP